jgi:Leucine-rich repeat (LRR) protein
MDTLTQLEEIYVSYNEIEQISAGLINNNKLRVLHLAYNDIRHL